MSLFAFLFLEILTMKCCACIMMGILSFVPLLFIPCKSVGPHRKLSVTGAPGDAETIARGSVLLFCHSPSSSWRLAFCSCLHQDLAANICLWSFHNVTWSRNPILFLYCYADSEELGVKYSEDLTMSSYLKANTMEVALKSHKDHLLNEQVT